MKKNIFLIGLAFFIFSCGGKKKADGTALGNEVCECHKKGKGLEPTDPKAEANMLECAKLQADHIATIGGNKTEEDAFNKVINDCWEQILK